jgi:lysozyme
MDKLIAEIKRHEGFRPMAYRDTEGFLTIGYGLNLDAGISEPLASHILEWQVNDRAKALAGKANINATIILFILYY